VKEYESAHDALLKVYDKDPGRIDPVNRHQNWPGWSFAPRFLKLATDHPEDPAAVDALLWVGRLGDNVNENYPYLLPFYGRALDILARDHLGDRRVQELCLESVGHDLSVPAERFLRTVLTLGPTREARGYACLGLARYLATKRTVAQDPWFDRPAKTPFDAYTISKLDAGWHRGHSIQEHPWPEPGRGREETPEGVAANTVSGADVRSLGDRGLLLGTSPSTGFPS
jgi:hypothetical protein